MGAVGAVEGVIVVGGVSLLGVSICEVVDIVAKEGEGEGV
jgi:hypothetical protein